MRLCLERHLYSRRPVAGIGGLCQSKEFVFCQLSFSGQVGMINRIVELVR